MELDTEENESGFWPTPTKNDREASGAAGYSLKNGRHSGTTLTDAVVGIRGGKVTQQKQTLNPAWVEWLMGLPIGATDLAPLVTAKCRSWLQRHGVPFGNDSTKEGDV